MARSVKHALASLTLGAASLAELGRLERDFEHAKGAIRA